MLQEAHRQTLPKRETSLVDGEVEEMGRDLIGPVLDAESNSFEVEVQVE
ncbi:hypothetical protein [Arthrobacter castelli]|nr:hypothetical protein [Arthrobacter castelli]